MDIIELLEANKGFASKVDRDCLVTPQENLHIKLASKPESLYTGEKAGG